MTPPRYRYAPGPPTPRGKTHPHDAGRPERAEAAAPRSEEVFLLRVRTDGPVIGRETLGRDRPAPRREPGGDPLPARRRAGSRTVRPEESLAGLLRRRVRPRVARAGRHGRPRPRVRGCGPRAALEGRQADEGPPRHGPRGGREGGARVAGERIRRLIRRSEPRIGSGRPHGVRYRDARG